MRTRSPTRAARRATAGPAGRARRPAAGGTAPRAPRTRPATGARDSRGPARARSCPPAATAPGSTDSSLVASPTRRSMRLRASVSRSSPRISSSGHRTLSRSEASAVVACRRSESRTASSWMIPANRARRPSSIPGMRRQVLARRADVREARSRPFDEPLEQRDALRVGVDRFGHVGEQQHVAGETARLRLPGRLPRDGRRLHPQQPPVAGRGDEVRPLALLALELPLHRLDRVQDQVAIDDAEHRAAETEERSVAAAEDALRGGVVEQDPALAVADEDALLQLGDERGEPAPLRLDAGVGVGHSGGDVRCERGTRLRQLVDRAGERLQLGRSGRARRDATRFPCAIRRTSSASRRAGAAVARTRRYPRIASAVASASPNSTSRPMRGGRERRPRSPRDRRASRSLQKKPAPTARIASATAGGTSAAASAPRLIRPAARWTFATSSRVENGLVTYASAPSSSPLATSTSRPFAESRITFTPRVPGSLFRSWHTS